MNCFDDNLPVDSHQKNSNTEQIIQRADSHHLGSNTEQTIQRCSASNTLTTSRPLVTKPNGLIYLKNPCNEYISKWPDGFSDFLACGSTNHRFASCSKRENVDDNYFGRNFGRIFFQPGKGRAILFLVYQLLLN